MCNVGAQRLSGPYVQWKAWKNISMGHPKLYAFAFKASKVKLLSSILLNITQHLRSVCLFNDHKVFLSMSALSLKWHHYFWTMTPKGFTIHLFCLSKHITNIILVESLVCQSWHSALSIPSPHWCAWCHIVQAPEAPAGMGGMCPLGGRVQHSFYKLLCFTGEISTPWFLDKQKCTVVMSTDEGFLALMSHR